jgi:hypothetical protein
LISRNEPKDDVSQCAVISFSRHANVLWQFGKPKQNKKNKNNKKKETNK